MYLHSTPAPSPSFFSSLPFLKPSSFHSLPDCKKWDMVAPNRQCTVHINENYFGECEKFFQIWNLTLGLKFPSCYPPGVPLPNTAVTGEAESQQRPSGEAGDLSPSWGPHTEPGVRISPEPTVDSSLSTSEQSGSVARSFITEGWANWGNGSLQISYLWQDFHDAAGFVIIHSSLLKFSFCSVFFSL